MISIRHLSIGILVALVLALGTFGVVKWLQVTDASDSELQQTEEQVQVYQDTHTLPAHQDTKSKITGLDVIGFFMVLVGLLYVLARLLPRKNGLENVAFYNRQPEAYLRGDKVTKKKPVH